MRRWFYSTLGLAVALSGAAAFGAQGCSGDDNPTTPKGTDASADGPVTPSPDGGETDGGPTGPVSKNPSRGSAIALSEDESILVQVNRDVGSITVFGVTYAADGSTADATKIAELPVGAAPWQVVIGPDNDTAYVVLRKDQKLVKVTGLKKAPAVAGSVAVGSEPTGLALTPTGAKVWVANWVDGTLIPVDTKTMAAGTPVDLNAALVKGVPTALGTIAPRPGLAHPRSVAITNNGNASDDDESILVTEFFAQHTAPHTADGANADSAKSAFVYKVKVSDKSVTTIKLAPIADMGFKDSAGGTAGCYPNQVQSIAISGKQAYVTSVCASPKGPIGVIATAVPPDISNVKTATHGAVSVFDIDTGAEITAGTKSLHAEFSKLYTAKATPDDGTRRYPLVPSDIGFVPGSNISYVAANGVDAVFRVRFDATGAFQEAGASNQNFINLGPTGMPATAQGKNPIGVAVSTKKFAFVANDVGRNMSIIDLNTQAVAGTVELPKVVVSTASPAAASPEDAILKGKRFFNTGLGRWSLKGQGWGACQSCHMDGYTDNITWHFARGPRQSVSLEGSFSKKNPNTDQRIFNWTAIFDEVADFEGNTRGVSGGVGAIVSVNTPPLATTDRIATDATTLPPAVGGPNQGLSGSSTSLASTQNPLALTAPSVLNDWAEITEWIKALRTPRGVSNVDPAKRDAGKTLFAVEGACQGCHGGDKWTISTRFYTPSIAQTGSLKSKAWTPPAGFPVALLPSTDVANRFMRTCITAVPGPCSAAPVPGVAVGAFDQLQCALRPVNTFGVFDPLTGISELRQDMTTPGQGNAVDGKGFNPPSLLGVSVGGPYLHAGNASSLEALFSPTFQTHYTALAPNFLSETDPTLRATKVSQLVNYLLSLDSDSPVVTIPTAGAGGGSFCAP